MPLFKYYLKKQTTSVEIDIYPAEFSAFLTTESPTASAEFDLIIADINADTRAEVSIIAINASIFAETYHYASCGFNIDPVDISCSLFSENQINAFFEMHNAEISASQGVVAYIDAIHANINCTFLETQQCNASINLHNADINIFSYSENYISAEIKIIHASILAKISKPENEMNAFIQMHNADVKANLFSVITTSAVLDTDIIIKFEEMAEVI